ETCARVSGFDAQGTANRCRTPASSKFSGRLALGAAHVAGLKRMLQSGPQGWANILQRSRTLSVFDQAALAAACRQYESGIKAFSADEAAAWKLLRSGDMFLPSSLTFQLAIHWLREHPETTTTTTATTTTRTRTTGA
ncbi:unnamed protein product, partial [Polarella glacialis]